MASPQMIIRIAANVEELRRNLADGKASIEALSPSVEKLASNWNKHSATLVQDARNIVAAVDKVGASTLTAGDSARAIKTLDAAMDQLRASSQPIPPLMQQTADRIRAMHGQMDAASTKTSAFGGILGKIGPMLIAAFSIGAIKSFVSAILDSADQLVKLSDKTGIGTVALQELKYVAEQSGNTLQDVTSAISMMQKRLAGGDDSAVGALQRLGISLRDFLDLSPDKQFQTFAEAVAAVQDPMERTKLATDLFGRAGAEVIPTMVANIQKLRDEAPKMSKEAVEGLDAVGDALGRTWTQTKNLGGELAGKFIGAWRELSVIWRGMPNVTMPVLRDIKALSASTAVATLSGNDLKEAYEYLDAELKKSQEATKKAAAEQAAAAAKTKAWNDSIKSASEHMVWLQGAMGSLGPVIQAQFTREIADANEALKLLDSTAIEFGTVTLPAVVKSSGDVGAGMKEGNSISTETAKSIMGAAKAFSYLSDAAVQAGHKTTAAIASIAAATLQAFAASGGNWWAAAGAAALSTFAALSGKIFKDQSRAVNDMRDAYVAAAGGLAALNEKARQAGMTLTEFLKASNITAYTAAVTALNAAFDRTAAAIARIAALRASIADLKDQIDQLRESQIPSWDAMAEAAARFGVSLDALGPLAAAVRITDSAAAILDAFNLLTQGGADAGGVLAGMADEISALVADSARFGTTIPENMKPLIDELIAAGLLLDAQGNKIKDTSGIKWGKPAATEADKMTAAMQDLIDKLEAAIAELAGLADESGAAADQVYDDWRRAPWSDWGRPEWPNGRGDNSFAGGTHGQYLNFGAGTPVVLHGRERVMTESEGRGGGGGGGETTLRVPIIIDGRVLTEAVIRGLPGRLAALGAR